MVDLEQFREAVEFMQMRGTREQCIRAGDMLQAIIDNAKQGAMVPTLPGNWPEDANHENGDYECLCSQCGTTFYGHKRRVVCKACAKPAPVVDDALNSMMIDGLSAMVNRAVAATAHPRATCLDHYEYAEAVIVAALARAQGVQSP